MIDAYIAGNKNKTYIYKQWMPGLWITTMLKKTLAKNSYPKKLDSKEIEHRKQKRKIFASEKRKRKITLYRNRKQFRQRVKPCPTDSPAKST